MGTNSTGCTEWERDYDAVTEQPRSQIMSDAETQAKINAWIDGWMIKLNDRTKEYQAQGMLLDVALDRATFDIRMEIRRAPPLELGNITTVMIDPYSGGPHDA